MTRTLITALTALTLIATAAIAHTPLKNVTPESGSILEESPDSVTLEFAQPVVLTQLRVAAMNAEERTIEFSPEGSSATFTSAAPNLGPGRNEVLWTALSPDGHVIEGTIILVVKPE